MLLSVLPGGRIWRSTERNSARRRGL